MANIKISQLPNINGNLTSQALMPIVSTNGTFITDKVTVATLANFILGESGNLFASADIANLAYNVINASQPNITTVGTLTGLTVVGTTNVGYPNNFVMLGGTAGQVLATFGNGSLGWVDQVGATGVIGNDGATGATGPEGATGPIGPPGPASTMGATGATGETGATGAFSSTLSANLDANGFNISNAGNITANYFIGTATNVEVEAVNNNYSYHIVLTTDPGDTTLHNDADDNLQYNPADGVMTVTRVDMDYLSVGTSVLSNLNPISNVTYDLGNTTNRWKDIYLANSTIYLGDATLSANGNSIVVDSITVTNGNVGTVGNIASLNLDGSNSNVLYGNGVFASIAGAGATGATGPAGSNGATGASGPGFVWQGAWQPIPTTYIGGQDVVSYAGGSYIKIGNGNSGSAPPDDPVRWSPVAEPGSSGATGAVGATGSAGTNGSDGATGATGPAGTNGTDGATGATGPQGDTGATGPAGASLPIANGTSNIDIATLDGNVTITANSTSTWTFGTDGLLTLPSGNVAIGLQYGSEAILASNTNFGVATQGANVTTFINWSDDVANTSLVSALYVNAPSANAGDIHIRTGGIGNANIWQFNVDGNLVLPGNTFSVNYANGVQVSLGGGGNTGNVTFDDVTVQGDNNSLNLSAGSDFTANLAYLQVRSGDVPSHIHLDTGNNEAYDLIVGDDQNYVQVSSTGNILLSAYDSNTAQYTWTLDYNGNLILAGGNSVIFSTANSSLDPTLPNVSTMTLTPDANYNSQVLVLDPTAPGHIHLRAYAFSNIDEPAANIFLGGEDTAFEITSGANNQAVIHSNGKSWTFGNDGNISSDTLTFTTTFANVKTVEYQTAGVWDLYVEDSITGSNTAISRLNVSFKDNLIDKPQVYIENTKESDGIALRWTFDENGNLNFPRDVAGNSDPYLNIFGGSTPTIQSTDVSLAGPANLAIQSDYLNLSGSTGNRIILQADAGAIATDAAMVLSTNLADPGNIVSWTLDTTGNLYLPDTTSVIANVSITLEANDSGNITGLSVIGDANANLYAHGNVTIVSDSSNTTATWAFGTNGNLTLPGNTVAINFANGSSAFGNIVATNLDGNVSNVLNGNGVFAAVPAPTVTQDITSNGAMSIMLFDGNIKYNNYATVEPSSGNIAGNNISASGNISANNFTGNGGTLSNVATKTSGSWTLATGVNTVSISIPLNGTYAIWINGNIPNGIITYTATAVITNTNVPVLGSQYAWYYAVGNALVFTSIPNQFTGTVGSISNVNTYAGNTANVFTFGITNNSGSTAVVNYGYTKL